MYEPISDATTRSSTATPRWPSEAVRKVGIGVRERRQLPAAAAQLGEGGGNLGKRLPTGERLAERVLVGWLERKPLALGDRPQAAGHHLPVGRAGLLALDLRLEFVVGVE